MLDAEGELERSRIGSWKLFRHCPLYLTKVGVRRTWALGAMNVAAGHSAVLFYFLTVSKIHNLLLCPFADKETPFQWRHEDESKDARDISCDTS